jgi:hypothetical protein
MLTPSLENLANAQGAWSISLTAELLGKRPQEVISEKERQQLDYLLSTSVKCIHNLPIHQPDKK